MLRFIKTTILGGILFLVPVIIFIAIIGKALQITNKLAIPISGLLNIDKIIGIAVVDFLAIGLLVLICFFAGLAAETKHAKKFIESLEVNVLGKIPAYEFLKAKTQSVLRFEETEEIRPAMARFGDHWQLAFEIERIEAGKVVLFLPGAPDPWSGSVCVVTEDRITPLDLTVKSTVNLMKRLGKGTTEALTNLKNLGNAFT